jgi:hypothetical protein
MQIPHKQALQQLAWQGRQQVLMLLVLVLLLLLVLLVVTPAALQVVLTAWAQQTQLQQQWVLAWWATSWDPANPQVLLNAASAAVQVLAWQTPHKQA